MTRQRITQAASLYLSGTQQIPFGTALIIKVVYGGLLGAIVTRVMFHWLLQKAV